MSEEGRAHTTGPPQTVTGSGYTLRLNVQKTQTVKTMFRNKDKADLTVKESRSLAGKFGKKFGRSAEEKGASLLHFEIIEIDLVGSIAILEFHSTNAEKLKVTSKVHINTSINIVSPSRLDYIKKYMTPLSICQEENKKR